ncbi:MAG: quinone-dependent dihydroorotate dehydrogenase [Bacteroidetes bacterium]|nr:quinone-dependent dihydroorotate dehydrogenase [Bacteroidota bacterium]
MYPVLRKILFSLDPERAHRLASGAARLAQTVAPFAVDSAFSFAHPSLHTEIFGQHFTNPIGLAAGFDKNAVLLPFWKNLGFGFVEVGSVTASRSRGNKRPRAFRLPDDEALINRMGLNNQGAERILRRVRRYSSVPAFPVGVNLAKTHDAGIEGEAAVEDFCKSFRLLAPFADYITLNISCPNTAKGRTFEDPNALDDLLTAIDREKQELHRRIPVLVKFSPPITDKFVLDSLIDELIMVSLAHGASGFVATNTASDRQHLTSDEMLVESIGAGGLSGPPIESRSTRLVRYLYRKTEGKLPIIGVGGVCSAETAYAKIKAGASLVQLYTGLVYHGPGLVRQIKKGLVDLLAEDGHSAIGKAVGEDA